MHTLQKHVLHISRHWDNPSIAVKVYSQGISLEISVEDFCRALAAEMPHPLTVLSRSKMESNLLSVVDAVLGKIKESSAHV
jgi:hypothetical protein